MKNVKVVQIDKQLHKSLKSISKSTGITLKGVVDRAAELYIVDYNSKKRNK